MNSYFIIFIGIIIVLVAFLLGEITRDNQRNKIDSITLGMPEAQMLEIMGGRYNKSLLKNNRIKYEWRYSNGHSYSCKGFRTYSGVRKIDIYCKDGFVEEVKPYNI